jgi:hypothetical protein
MKSGVVGVLFFLVGCSVAAAASPPPTIGVLTVPIEEVGVEDVRKVETRKRAEDERKT